ncbi:MAG: hypothetical protein R2757_14810 [Draconibacterium sp.]
MKNLRFLALLCAIFITSFLNAQNVDSIQVVTIDKTSLGLGIGMDHGGFGANFMYCPTQSVGLFAGAGYAIAGLGINAGVKVRFISKSPSAKASAFGLLMYGYNAAIGVSNAREYNKLFYGPTLGVGMDLRSPKNKKGYWSVALLLPIRSSDVNDYMDDLESYHGVEFKTGLVPVGISVGYRFIIN